MLCARVCNLDTKLERLRMGGGKRHRSLSLGCQPFEMAPGFRFSLLFFFFELTPATIAMESPIEPRR